MALWKLSFYFPVISTKSRIILSTTEQLWHNIQVQHYWNKRAPRTPPTKPLSFDYSGDLTHSVGTFDLRLPKPGFEDLPEYKNADERVKKIVSLEFSSKAVVIDKVIQDLVEKVRDHPLDVQSTEINIAKDTVLIRNQIQHCLKFRNDKVSKSLLIERIQARNKMLRRLLRQDVEKFNWLVEELQIRLPPVPEPGVRLKLSKREKRQAAAREAWAAIIGRKQEELRKRCAAEKAAFDEFKDAELADIRKSLHELGLGETSSLEQTVEALGASDLLPKKDQKVSLSQQKFAVKMDMLGKEKRRLDAEMFQAHGFIVPKSWLAS